MLKVIQERQELLDHKGRQVQQVEEEQQVLKVQQDHKDPKVQREPQDQ